MDEPGHPFHGLLAARLASVEDAAAIAGIYNQGIEDRTATFETDFRSAGDVHLWFDAVHPIVVVEDGPGGTVVGFASTSVYRPRRAYSGIAEFSVYVARGYRRQGVGRLAMEALADAAAAAGFWKLVSRVMVTNKASRGLLASVGFREVGVYRRHARLEGIWRDVVVVERLIGEAAEDAAAPAIDPSIPIEPG
jgi:L-amino acid N-acyltransferase YncA